MPPKPREMSYSEGLSEGSPNRPGAKNLVAGNFETLQANISQLIAGFNQLRASGVDKQDFEKLRNDVQQLTMDRLDIHQFAKVRNDIQQLTVDCEGTQPFQTQCTGVLENITTTAKTLTASLANHGNQLELLKARVQEIAKAVQDLGKLPSKEAFDILLNDVRQIDGKIDTLTQKAVEKAELEDATTGSKAGEDDVDADNDGTGANDLHESPQNENNLYRGLPQTMGRNLLANSEQAAQGGDRAPQSLGVTSQTHTHGSQRNQATAKNEQFWIHIKLWEINWAGERVRGGQELMQIKANSTLRDLEIQIENYVKKIQKGDISKRANLKEPHVFYWSTEHVVDNIKAMRDMDGDENMWSSNLGDGAVIINEDNDIGVMDWLKREIQMPWLSVTIKPQGS